MKQKFECQIDKLYIFTLTQIITYCLEIVDRL